MLPTTYRGNATIDGEHLEAELRLDDGHVRLAAAAGHHAELLRWPIAGLAVETTDEGDYLLQVGDQSFRFAPRVDDGLGHEIAMRARFASPRWVSEAPEIEEVLATPETPLTVAEYARSNGAGAHTRKRPNVLTGADLGIRSAIVVLAVLAVAVVTVALVSGSFGSDGEEVSAGEQTARATLPFTEGDTTDTSLSGLDTSAPATPLTVPGAVPTTVVAGPPATTPTTAPTTLAPPTTVPPTTAPSLPEAKAFDLTPAQAVAQWDAVALGLGTGMAASNTSVDGSGLSFEVGEFVVVDGEAGSDGRLASITFLGDPSGTVTDDRAVLTALGLTVALLEPDFPPQWRRDLLDELGLDVDNPELAGLDGSLTYQGIDYNLRWDGELSRLVLEAGRVSTESD